MNNSNHLKFIACIAICLTSLLLSFTNAVSQTIEVRGFVIEELSGEPIPGANVYIENKSIGSSTDKNGFFSFTTTVSGKHTIAISFVGYHKAFYTIDLNESLQSRDLKFELRPERIKMDDVVISVDNSEWQNNYQAFVKEFIGTDRLASQTTIRNYWVLDFVRSPSGELSATASEPLIVENRGLGYLIQVRLKGFMWELNNEDGLMLLDLQFSELSAKDSRERQKWAINREKAFHGSLSHFLQSLFHDRLSNNQFEVVGFQRYNPERIYEAKPSREVILALVRHGYTPSDYGEEVKAFRILRHVDILYGIETRIKNDRKRARLIPENESGIFLVRKDGTFVNPSVIGVDGYWRTERLANKLPTELVNSLLIN